MVCRKLSKGKEVMAGGVWFVLMRRMAWSLPNKVRPPFRWAYRILMRNEKFRRILVKSLDLDECHTYWHEPPFSDRPQRYLIEGLETSELLLGLVDKYARTEDKILEIGCNAGRNLGFLLSHGYENLYGIEICPKAVELLAGAYPSLAQNICVGSVEDIIRDVPDKEYDITFTTLVLEHIHNDSEWVFAEMVRITRKALIILEDEVSVSFRTFPRNYRDVFERLGMEQLEERDCRGVVGLSGSCVARVFANGVVRHGQGDID